ncbi:hypothetical protein [Bacillus velezensis]
MEKFAGVGVKNLIVIAMFTMMTIVVLKVVLAKHEVNGISQLVHAV